MLFLSDDPYRTLSVERVRIINGTLSAPVTGTACVELLCPQLVHFCSAISNLL